MNIKPTIILLLVCITLLVPRTGSATTLFTDSIVSEEYYCFAYPSKGLLGYFEPTRWKKEIQKNEHPGSWSIMMPANGYLSFTLPFQGSRITLGDALVELDTQGNLHPVYVQAGTKLLVSGSFEKIQDETIQGFHFVSNNLGVTERVWSDGKVEWLAQRKYTVYDLQLPENKTIYRLPTQRYQLFSMATLFGEPVLQNGNEPTKAKILVNWQDNLQVQEQQDVVVRTWVLTDLNGNERTHQQTITIQYTDNVEMLRASDRADQNQGQ